ncbi:MAG: tetratricopeptide repeat protein [Candidatus Wallbacteria bacterium]|nr:tetratricopeptide repeat protein [Candidatus Wallbacteria bacterium]
MKQFRSVETDSLPELEGQLMATENPVEIATLLKKIAYTGVNRAAIILKTYLNHGDKRVRANAVEGLGYFNDPELAPFLLGYLERESDPRIKGNIIKILWKYGTGPIREELKKMLVSPNLSELKSGLHVSEQIDDSLTYELLTEASSETSRESRRLILESRRKLSSAPAKYIVFGSKVSKYTATILGLIFLYFAFGWLYRQIPDRGKKGEDINKVAVNQLHRTIAEALGHENYSLAIEYLDQLLRLTPVDRELKLKLAFCYYRLGSLDNAEAYYLESIKDFPREEAFHGLCRVYFKNGNLEKMLSLIIDYQKNFPKGSLREILEANKLLMEKGLEAAASYRETLTVPAEPLCQMALNDLDLEISAKSDLERKNNPSRYAVFLIKKGDYQGAIGVFRDLIDFDSRPTEAYFMLADCYLKIGSPEKARKILQQLLSQGYSRGRVYAKLAEAYLSSGDYGGAYYMCRQGITRGESPELHLLMARISSWFRADEQACQEVDRLLGVSTEPSVKFGGYLQQGAIFHRAGNLAACLCSLDRALKIKPDDPEVGIKMLSVRVEAGTEEIEDLILETDKLCRKDPANPELNNLLGILYYKMGKLEPAISCFKRIMEHEISDWKLVAMNNLGICHAKAGQLSEAEQILDLAFRTSSNPDVCCNLGRLYQQLGQNERARSRYFTALKSDPYHMQALLGLTGKTHKAGDEELSEKLREIFKTVLDRNRMAEPDFSDYLPIYGVE